MVREREGGRKKEREGKEIVFKTVFANVCASAPLFLFFFFRVIVNKLVKEERVFIG